MRSIRLFDRIGRVCQEGLVIAEALRNNADAALEYGRSILQEAGSQAKNDR
jgi:hypothetical protein